MDTAVRDQEEELSEEAGVVLKEMSPGILIGLAIAALTFAVIVCGIALPQI